MTNNEAIGILAIVVETAKGRCFVTDEAISDAYAMAIKALEAQELSKNSPELDKENGDLQPTCNQLAPDCISRQAALDAVFNNAEHPDKAYEAIRHLPSAQPEIEERTEEFAQNVPQEDLISRKAAIDAAESAFVRGVFPTAYIRELPSAQPERKKGKWIEDRCSECGCYVYHGDVRNFCPMCGADMRGDNHDQSK